MNPKKLAAEHAVQGIANGMIVGLGTGSTAYWAIVKIGERVKSGLQIQAVASSEASEQLAIEHGIPIVPFEDVRVIDVYIDGADEVDSQWNLIKGGGGALLREKICAYHSTKFIVIVDESKLVHQLGRFPLPVEIVPFAHSLTLRQLEKLHVQPSLRMKDGQLFRTDNGNYIVDCHFTSIEDPESLDEQINQIPGVVDNGLFIRMASQVIVGHLDGRVTVL